MLTAALFDATAGSFGSPLNILQIMSTALLAAALLVFAFGAGKAGSITARRPIGTTAMIVLACWTVFGGLVEDHLYPNEQMAIGLDANPDLMSFGYATALGVFLLAIIASLEIALAGRIKRPWNWALLWVLAAQAIPWVALQLIAGHQDDLAFISATLSLVSLLHSAGPIFLGVLALGLARQLHASRAVVIFKSDRDGDS